jgi:hypothetical protein
MKTCPGGVAVPVTEECPKLPLAVSISAGRDSICAGDDLRFTPTGQLPPNARYQWSINGQPAGYAPTFTVPTLALAPGHYAVDLTVSADEYNSSTARATFELRPHLPPTGTLSVDAPMIQFGQTTTLHVSMRPGECGGNVRVAYAASEGRVSGNVFDSSTISFEPFQRAAQSKVVTITASLQDDRGEGTTLTTAITVTLAASATSMGDIVFALNDANLTDVCGIRFLLEDLSGIANNDPGGKLLLIGHTDRGEDPSLDEKRVTNAARLSTFGLDPARVFMYEAGDTQNTPMRPFLCGPELGKGRDPRAPYRRVEVVWVPSGAPIPAFAAGARDAASLPKLSRSLESAILREALERIHPVPSEGIGGSTGGAKPPGNPTRPEPPVEEGDGEPSPPQSPSAAVYFLIPRVILWIVVLVFMLIGIWTASNWVRRSAWWVALTAPKPPPPLPGARYLVIVHDNNGYAVQTQCVVIYYFEDEDRVKALCAGLVKDRYRFSTHAPGFPEGSPRWKQNFTDALNESEFAFVLLSGSAMGRPWLTWQIENVRHAAVPWFVVGLDQGAFDIAHMVNLATGIDARTVELLTGVKWHTDSAEDQEKLKSLFQQVQSSATRGLHCFISYSRVHRDFAERLCRDLRAAVVDAWMDDAIEGGTYWKDEIAKAIEKSTHMIFLLTPESIQSKQVRKEIDWAEKKSKIIVPVMETEVDLPFGFPGIQAINFASGYDQGFRKLLHGLVASAPASKPLVGSAQASNSEPGPSTPHVE